MAAVRAPALRRFLLCRPALRAPQRRWAQVHDVRFLATHGGAQERVLAKYKEKLENKARQEGLNDINELRNVYKDKIEDLRKQAAVPGVTAPLKPTSDTASASASPSTPTPSTSAHASPPATPQPPHHAPPTPPPSPKPAGNGNSNDSKNSSKAPPGVKTLSSFLDIPKILTLPQKEIEVLWRLRHAANEASLAAVLPATSWAVLALRARKHPQFVLPLPREGAQGAEIHFLQWTFPAADTATVLFTHLAEYKLRGEFSSPHTTVSFHQELVAAKGLVLVQGQVVPGRGVAVDEAKWLLMCLQKFYGVQAQESPARGRLLEQFSAGDGGFDVDRLLEEAEKAL